MVGQKRPERILKDWELDDGWVYRGTSEARRGRKTYRR
jgi:hypothetical protein